MATEAKKKENTGAKYKYLVIVESPAKAKTIEKFLGKDYHVIASNGHLIDLPKSKIGIDIENNFEPEYIVIRGKTSLLNELKKEAKASSKVYIATDPDREGEAISWHIANALSNPKEDVFRIEFNEITKNAVTNAIKNPREVDQDRVDAQQARRVLDRLVGYEISPLLWRKVKKGLSAGRVQSATVKLVVDREREIRAFKPDEFWTIKASLTDKEGNNPFNSMFYGKGSKKIVPKSEDEVKEIISALDKENYVITSRKESLRYKRAFAPFTTSTLQQDASRKLNFTTKRTMMVAQTLYEGVKVNQKGDVAGLITYMRTDSTRLSEEARSAAKEYILKNFGEKYYPQKPNIYSGNRNAQDAHEAIRPTYVNYTPESVKPFLTSEQYRLYNLIYTRFMASQMAPAAYDTMNYVIDNNGYSFRSSFSKVKFPGFMAVYKVQDEEEDEEVNNSMPPMKEGDVCIEKQLDPKQNFTSPPQRYTEASLVKTLEELGIGRPSTYATTISTIQDRKYVAKEKKFIVPTDIGEIVNDLLEDSFPDIVSSEFTAHMESELDTIETDGKDWHSVIREFYGPFEKELKKASSEIEHVKFPDRPSGEKCELCGGDMMIKMGRYGEFLGCSNYPACRNTRQITKQIDTPCPKCGGKLVQKSSRKGAQFYGCSNYPECDFVSWDLPLKENCKECGSYMVLKHFRGRSYKKCSNPECVTNQRRSKTQKENED